MGAFGRLARQIRQPMSSIARLQPTHRPAAEGTFTVIDEDGYNHAGIVTQPFSPDKSDEAAVWNETAGYIGQRMTQRRDSCLFSIHIAIQVQYRFRGQGQRPSDPLRLSQPITHHQISPSSAEPEWMCSAGPLRR